MKIYLVGGAVRDKLLGLPVHERDWVVIDSNPEAMLAAGFQQVGKSFPVFLHPETKEEYALARTEQKTGPGYQGFSFATDGVTLEEDLARRDLTINAMAETEQGEIIDPFAGQADLSARVLRHVGAAFIEDPVRVLRVARFAARFGHFHVAEETQTLMQNMVAAGEVDALVPERVWQEWYKALCAPHPGKFLIVLHNCGALARILPEIDELFSDTAQVKFLFKALVKAVKITEDTVVRFAIFGHALNEVNLLQQLAKRLALPNEYYKFTKIIIEHNLFQSLNAEKTLNVLLALNSFKNDELFVKLQAFLHAFELDKTAEQLAQALKSTVTINVQAVIDDGFTKADITTELNRRRLQAITEQLS